MVKQFLLLKRAPTITHEQFRARWLGVEDARPASGKPAGRRCVRNAIDQTPVLPFPHGVLDGVQELWLADEDGARALEAPRYAGFVDSGASVGLLAGEHCVLDRGGGPIKFMSLLRRREGTDSEAFSVYWATKHAALVLAVPEVSGYFRRYVQNHCIPGTSRSLNGSKLPFELDGIVEIWFDSVRDLERAMISPRYMEVLRPDESVFVALPNIRMLVSEEHEIPCLRQGRGRQPTLAATQGCGRS